MAVSAHDGERICGRSSRDHSATLAVQSTGFADIIYRVQAADTLAGPWSNIAAKQFASSWSGPGSITLEPVSNGYIPVSVQDVAPPGGTQRFLRLQIQRIP